MINPSSVVKGKFIFPSDLTCDLIIIPGVENYYWDPEGDRVISMKSPKGPYQMKRNEVWDSPGNQDSYYSLTLGKGQGSRIYLLSELRKMSTQPQERKKEENMKQDQYIIGSIMKSSVAWSITQHPMVHSTLEAAKTEASRLARTEPTKKFIVLKVEGVVTLADIVWE